MAAMAALDEAPLHCLARAAILTSRPLGPSQRDYANSAALVATSLPPLAMLDALQAIEARFGRKRQRRWGARTLDLDLLLWSGGRLTTPRLILPHREIRKRDFVLIPLAQIAPNCRDPVSGHSITQLAWRLNHAKPVDHAAQRH